jgi:hypothetical protein
VRTSLHRYILNLLTVVLVVALWPALAVCGAGYLLAYAVNGWVLHWRFLAKWGREGKRLFLVYSETRDWQRHIEERWLPRLTDCAVVLRWSGSREWKLRWPLESRVMRHWGGDREYNPLAIYFPWIGLVRVIRFWRAFKEHKRGKDRRLREAEARLFRLAERLRRTRT